MKDERAQRPTGNDPHLRLQHLSDDLKTTHIGVDVEIGRLLNAAVPWLLFAQAQRRPRVIGLWGTTGTGKTSLVRELVKALRLEDRTFWLDAGECHGEYWLDVALGKAYTHHNGKPMVLVVDEFQHARTVRMGIEQEEPVELRRLWELIDTGHLRLTRERQWGLTALLDLYDRLAKAIRKGVSVKNGRVVSGHIVHQEVMGIVPSATGQEADWFVSPVEWESMRDSMSEPISLLELRERLEALDGPGTMAMLADLIERLTRPVVLDASHALVVVLGNLDALDPTHRTPMPELDPDVLMFRHQVRCATGVQQALMDLFRVEQVARLGSDHIVFPPVGKATVLALAERECRQLAEGLSQAVGIPVHVGTAVVARIQREAAIAVLGARPVVDAVHQVLPGLLGQVMLHPQATSASKVRLDLREEEPCALMHVADSIVSMRLTWPLQRGALVVPRTQAERQAVHEAGHLLCGTLLLGRTPLHACARTSSERIGGFVEWAMLEEVITRGQVVLHLAQMLGGYTAEHLVYGEQEVSTGSSNDLLHASQFALDMIKAHGLGSSRLLHAAHPLDPGPGFHLALAEAEEEARALIAEAEALARTTLLAHRGLLDRVSAQLVEHGSLGHEALRALLGDVAPTVFRRPGLDHGPELQVA